MAGSSATYTYSESYSAPDVNRHLSPLLPRRPGGETEGYKAKTSQLLRRILNMASCSQQSRKVLVVLRRQLGTALELEGLTPSTSLAGNGSSTDYSAIVSCRNCEGFMVQPVCLPCGHSICKGCTEKSNVVSRDNLSCPTCNQVCPKIPPRFFETASPDPPQAIKSSDGCRAPTVIIQNAFRRWYPDWAESCRCREEGNMYANTRHFTAAVKCYSQALETGMYWFMKSLHQLHSWRR